MSNSLITWLNFFLRYIYNFMYSVQVPGLNIPFVYFFIIFSILFLVFGIFRRLLFSPITKGRNASVKGKKSNDNS